MGLRLPPGWGMRFRVVATDRAFSPVQTLMTGLTPPLRAPIRVWDRGDDTQ